MADTIESLAASFRRDLKADGKADRTITVYGQALTFYCQWLAENGVAEPTTDHLTRAGIRDFIVHLRDDLGLSDSTRAIRFSALRRFCRWAVAEGILDRSPMEGMTGPAPDEHPVPVLEDAAIIRLLKTCAGKDFKDRRDEAIIRMLLDSGVRVAECAGMQLADLDLDASAILIMGKGSRPRVAMFGARTARAVDRYLRLRRAHSYASSASLWLSQRGGLSSDGIDQMLRNRSQAAGLDPPVHAHQFRHTAAHYWKASGGQEQDLKRIMGWRSDAMLARYGSSLADERAREAHRRMAPGDRL